MNVFSERESQFLGSKESADTFSAFVLLCIFYAVCGNFVVAIFASLGCASVWQAILPARLWVYAQVERLCRLRRQMPRI